MYFLVNTQSEMINVTITSLQKVLFETEDHTRYIFTDVSWDKWGALSGKFEHVNGEWILESSNGNKLNLTKNSVIFNDTTVVPRKGLQNIFRKIAMTPIYKPVDFETVDYPDEYFR
jgi:hypothetical protein